MEEDVVGSGGASADQELPRPLSAAYQSDFAYETVKDRLPVILTCVIDELYRDRELIIQQYGEDTREKIKTVIGRLSQLKSGIQTGKPIGDIEDDREDVALWNQEVKRESGDGHSEPTWFSASWLFVECYMYRKIQEAFEMSKVLKMFDPFENQKKAAFTNSLTAIKTLAQYLEAALAAQHVDSEQPTTNFLQLLQADLWGNRCDLSISVGQDNAQQTDPIAQLDRLRANILVDDTARVWQHLRQARDSRGDHVRVDLVLDNAGFELFADLCLADFLLSRLLATRIVFHVKSMPWFISDTTERDFHAILRAMHQEPALSQLAMRWEGHMERGEWTVRPDPFWTLPHDFAAMPAVSPTLYAELSRSALLLFKGDLNYRKLTGDRKWEASTPFAVALRGFRPAGLCSLRTLKADVVVGLLPGQAESLDRSTQRWMLTGDYAVIQYAASSAT